ncbi:MAG: hypothetical protein HUJ68_07065, partial [Clostridia bacterium]|nr:hypothetical protein [Clostridia bacterium]
MKKIVFIIIVSLIITSCRTTYNFSNYTEAQTSIVSDLKSKKVVFIGENHSDSFPIVFLANYLDEFYEEGLRYIFLEGCFPRLQFDSTVYKIIPPWINSGWKYENHIFEDKILDINSKHKNDPIHVIFPESGFIEEAAYDIEGQSVLLNKRDSYAQNNIIQVLECTKIDEKAIIFYGRDHGNKNIQKFYNLDWKPIGTYLDDYYNSDFVNYRIDTFYNSSQIYGYFGKKNCVVVSDSMKLKLYNEELITSYDRLCVSKTAIYGVPYCYIPTKENIIVLIQNILSQEKSLVKNEAQPTVIGNYYMQFLLSIYYLKYYFGDTFSYKILEDNLSQLQTSTDNIMFLINQNPKTSFIYNAKNGEQETYFKFLYSYGMIEEYLYHPNQNYIANILYNLKQAKKINSHDIWPQYWISYFETEKACYSNIKEDYKTALINWEKLFENNLFYASPIIKLAYEKASLCAEISGETEKSFIYQGKANDVNSLLDFDYEACRS